MIFKMSGHENISWLFIYRPVPSDPSPDHLADLFMNLYMAIPAIRENENAAIAVT